MKKQERADWIASQLESLYPETSIPLDHHDPYTLLVAVVLSAQCTDKMVNRVTPALFKLANTPAGMAKLPVAKIQEIIRPCGLSPANPKHSRTLENSRRKIRWIGATRPGVARRTSRSRTQTASVVMCQAFGQAAFPVDTHIHRLATRWRLTSGKNVEQTERDLKKLYPESSWAKLHLQIIFYGREHCSARGATARAA